MIEVSVATAMVALFIAGLMMMNSNLLTLLRGAQENVSASQFLQERVEQMRIANWLQITDATYLAEDLVTTAAASAAGLKSPTETITVSAYPARAGVAKAEVIRGPAGIRTVSSNPSLKDERMVRVDIRVVWRGTPRNRERVRMTTALLAKGGIAK